MTTATARSDKALDRQVTSSDIANLFGISPAEVEAIVPASTWAELRYHVLDDAESAQITAGIEARMQEGKLRIVGGDDNTVWENGWGEILRRVEKEGFTPAILRPQYFDHHGILRYNGHYIDTGDTTFVYAYDQMIRRMVFALYLKDTKRLVELGCGTGSSQLLLAELYPQMDLTACDWATPSQKIIGHIAAYLKHPIAAARVNMLNMDGSEQVKVDSDTTVLTVHALEQLGSNIDALMGWLMRSKPALCLHLEPIVELYGDSPFDDLARRYHLQRNYLQNWLTSIRTAEKQGKAEIIDVLRLGFGDRNHEAYSIVAWRPL